MHPMIIAAIRTEQKARLAAKRTVATTIGRGGGQVGGSGWWGRGGGQCGCERNVGGRGDVGYGGCEPRIEGIVQCTKRYCTILRKRKKCGGGGRGKKKFFGGGLGGGWSGGGSGWW